ncbi:hypothetical protein Nmel_018041 [Mimus melanotis]
MKKSNPQKNFPSRKVFSNPVPCEAAWSCCQTQAGERSWCVPKGAQLQAGHPRCADSGFSPLTCPQGPPGVPEQCPTL